MSKLFTTPVPLQKVQVPDPFWKSRMEIVRTRMIPYQWRALHDAVPGAAPSHCIRNFSIAAGLEKGRFEGYVFQDSDLAKWLEAVAYTLIWRPDASLEQQADEAIDLICAAQQPDGYMDTYYIINGLEKRFTNLRDHHELYCLGHMVEAAVAYHASTGKAKLLNAVCRCVDLVDSLFGPEPEKKHGYPGHEILEMALIRLYETTQQPRYLRLAQYFINQRGQQPLYFDEEARRRGEMPAPGPDTYRQADIPVREQQHAEGHAVRAVYLYSGMADVARLSGDDGLQDACTRLWQDVVQRQMYVTGGIGATGDGEAFTIPYDLPNDTNYAETCASVGLVFLAQRMLRSAPKAEYADVMECALYNGTISGMTLDGERFFYVNPLEVEPEIVAANPNMRDIKIERQKWFGCACCPPNLARLIASLGSYLWTYRESTLYQHLYVGARTELQLGGHCVQVCVETEYPWKPAMRTSFSMDTPAAFTYALRIPGWCSGKFTLACNGAPVSYQMQDGYALIERTWQNGDSVMFVPDMPVQRLYANPRVRDDIGKVAIRRGPVVYCLEEADNGKGLQRVYLPTHAVFTERPLPQPLGKGLALACTGLSVVESSENAPLYQTTPPTLVARDLLWIPYYAWANRAAGEMTVWVHAMSM